MSDVKDRNGESLVRVREQLEAVIGFSSDLTEVELDAPVETIEFEFNDRRNDSKMQVPLVAFLGELAAMCPHAPTGAHIKLATFGVSYGAAVVILQGALETLDRWIEERSR